MYLAPSSFIISFIRYNITYKCLKVKRYFQKVIHNLDALDVKTEGECADKQHDANQDPDLKASQVVVIIVLH